MAFDIVKALGACVVVVLGAAPPAAADLAQYRQFRLGTSTAAVAKQGGSSSPRDLKTTLLWPAVLQELEWRPLFARDRGGLRDDPVRRLVFSFVDDQLQKIVVEYERHRTEGLTSKDMVAALSVAYGPHDQVSPPESEPGEYDALEAAVVIARWRTAETTVTLHRYDYIGGYALVVASARLGRLAQKARGAANAELDPRDSAARGAMLLNAQAAAAREASERIRSANKARFTP